MALAYLSPSKSALNTAEPHHQALIAKTVNEAILNITPITRRTALNATAVDKRIRAVVAATMSDMTRVMSNGYNDSVPLEQRAKFLEH